MRLLISVILFSSLFVSCIGQKDGLSKSKLNKVFRKSILQDSRKRLSTLSNPWISDNVDSLYYKSKLIKLTNYKSDEGYVSFCDDVNWSFYRSRSRKFIIKECQNCIESPTCSASQDKDWIEIKIYKLETNLILELYNYDHLVDKFEVISLIDSNMKSEITLKRLEID